MRILDPFALYKYVGTFVLGSNPIRWELGDSSINLDCIPKAPLCSTWLALLIAKVVAFRSRSIVQ